MNSKRDEINREFFSRDEEKQEKTRGRTPVDRWADDDLSCRRRVQWVTRVLLRRRC